MSANERYGDVSPLGEYQARMVYWTLKWLPALATNSGFPGVIAVFPVIGHAGVAKNEPDQIGEARLGANIVRQDDNATLTGLDADHGVGGLAIVATFVEAMPLRAVEGDDTETREQILALLTQRQVGKEKGELMSRSDVQAGLCHLGA